MKTYAKAKTTAHMPSPAHGMPTVASLKHYEQLRQALRRAGIQPRLEIGPVDDPLEREAEAAAQRVLRMPEPEISKPMELAEDGPVHAPQRRSLNGGIPQEKWLQRQLWTPKVWAEKAEKRKALTTSPSFQQLAPNHRQIVTSANFKEHVNSCLIPE